MRYFLLFTLVLLELTACNNSKQEQVASVHAKTDSSESGKSTISSDTIRKTMMISTNERSRERFGERLIICGDFNGDGKIDSVFESYISALSGKETFKDLDTTDWENNEDLILKNKPLCRIYTNIPSVDTFILTNDFQQQGIDLFENLGDLNGEGGDELGYIIDWADESNINRYHIITLTKENKWKELLNFQINESVNYDSENLFSNHSVITKNGTNKIKYKFYSDSATVEEGHAVFR